MHPPTKYKESLVGLLVAGLPIIFHHLVSVVVMYIETSVSGTNKWPEVALLLRSENTTGDLLKMAIITRWFY